MTLLTSQRAALFDEIKRAGLRPEQFRLTRQFSKVSHLTGDVVILPETPHYFLFDTDPKAGRMSAMSPGYEKTHLRVSAPAWDAQLIQFHAWCDYVKREIMTVDPWIELERQSVSLKLSPSEDTPATPFSMAEIAQVQRTMLAIQGLLLAEAGTTKATQQTIKTDVAKLIESAKSQDRKQWFYLAVGYVLSTVTSLGLDPEKTRQIFAAFKHGIEPVVKLITG